MPLPLQAESPSRWAEDPPRLRANGEKDPVKTVQRSVRIDGAWRSPSIARELGDVKDNHRLTVSDLGEATSRYPAPLFEGYETERRLPILTTQADSDSQARGPGRMTSIRNQEKLVSR